MGSEKLTIRDLLGAGRDGVVEACKTTPIVALPLGFLDSIRKRCGELDRQTLVDLSLQAKQIQIDDIREALGDLYADQADLRQEVESFAQSFVTFLATNESLPQTLDELQKGQREILRITSRTEGKVDRGLENDQRIEEKLDSLLDSKDGFVTSTHDLTALPGESGRFHGEIDAAAQCLKRCEPDAALILLKQLEERNWSSLTPRERYRVKANMGHAYRQKGEDDRAADLFLQAHSYQSEDANAIALAARAYIIKGDKKHASEFAEKAYTEDTHCSSAVSVYLEASPEHTPLENLEAVVPDSLSSDWEVCCELALRALRQECFSKGEEYARRAIQANPDEPYPYHLLGAVLLKPEVKRAIDTRSLNDCDAERLREAISAFNESESRSRGMRRDRDHALLLVNRGAAHAMLEDDDDAESDFRAAQRLAPEDVDVVYNLANLQYRCGDASKALRTLSAIPPSDHSKRCVFLSLDAARATGDTELMRKAWGGALEAQIPWDEAELRDRVTYLSLMSQNRAVLGDPDKGLEFLRGETGDGVPVFYQGFLSAQVHLASHAISEAKPFLRKALEALDDTVDRPVVFSLGRSLYVAGLAEEAWSILKDEVSRERVSEEAALLMNCALAAGHDDFVMEFCADLRKHGAYDKRFIEVELHQYASYHSLMRCIALCQDALEQDTLSDPFKRHLRMRLSSFAVLLEREGLIEQNADNLSAVDEVQPEWALAMVQTLLHTTTPEKALDYGYALFRRYPDDARTWHAVIASAGLMSGREIPARHVDCVEPDAAVRYRNEDTGETRWCIIETLENPQRQLDEVPPDHPLARAMEEKNVNETFDLPGPARTGTILEILDKRAYRWRYCMNKFADYHPEEATVWAIRTDSADGIEGLVRRILEKTKPHREQVEDIIAVYRENELPVSAVASGLGKTCFETAMILADTSTDLPLRFAWGNYEEQENGPQRLRDSPRLIVDATAFVSIVHLGLWETFKEWHADLITTEAIREQLVMYADPRLRSEKTLSSVPDTSGEERLVVSPSDAENALKDAVGRFLKDSDRDIGVVGGDALARLKPQPYDDLAQVVGQCTLAAIAVAQEQDGVLWIDDRVTARVVAEYWPGVKTVNTQSILTHLQEVDLLEQNRYYDLLFQMLVCGYTHVLLDANGFRYAIETTNGNLSDPRLEAVLGLLGNVSVVPPSIVELALQSIKYVWQCGEFPIRAESLTVHILGRVISRPDGRALVQQIARRVESVFSLDVMNAARASVTCRTWLGRQVLSG